VLVRAPAVIFRRRFPFGSLLMPSARPSTASASTLTEDRRPATPAESSGIRAFAAAAAIALLGLGGLAVGVGAVAEALPAPAVEPGTGLDLVLIGGLLFLGLYNGLLFLPTRQPSYLLYAGLGLCLSAVYATYFDAGAELLGLDARPVLRNRVNHVASGSALALALAFALAFLRVRQRRPRRAAVGYGVAVGAGLFAVGAVPLLDARVAEVVNAAMGLLLVPTVLGLGVAAWRRGFVASRYYLAAWAPLLVVVLLSALEVVFATELGVGGRALLLANLLEMLLLALALTDRITLSIEARERAHRHALRELADELESVKRLGPYTLVEKIGEGGMGVVYEARHALLRRRTAIKLIHPREAGEQALQRFEREVRSTSRLTHPNTVTVYDYGRTPEGLLYYAMELLEGATLRDVVEVGGAQPPARVVHVLAMVAGALAEAHGIGLVHRDIKPGNIILTRQGGAHDVAKVVDFGLVKEVGPDAVHPELSTEAPLAGTPLYMAPELLADPPRFEARSDLYALGAVAFHMLTGTQLFAGGSVFEVILRHMKDEPPRPSEVLGAPIPDDLEALVLALLAKDVEDRPPDAATVQRRAEACACFGEWTEADAAAWWREHEAALAALRQRRRARAEAAPEPSPPTLQVTRVDRGRGPDGRPARRGRS
jgi:tRNA A-37 threonylcarbamoyl transferase component Bud32